MLPSLVQVDEEDHVVSETSQPVGRRHGDDEGEYIIDEGVESLGGTMANRYRHNNTASTTGLSVIFWMLHYEV